MDIVLCKRTFCKKKQTDSAECMRGHVGSPFMANIMIVVILTAHLHPTLMKPCKFTPFATPSSSALLLLSNHNPAGPKGLILEK